MLELWKGIDDFLKQIKDLAKVKIIPSENLQFYANSVKPICDFIRQNIGEVILK